MRKLIILAACLLACGCSSFDADKAKIAIEGLIEDIIADIEAKDKPDVAPTPEPPKPEPPAPTGELDFAKVKYYGKPYGPGTEVSTLRVTALSRSHVRFAWDKVPAWDGSSGCIGVVCMFWQAADGQWYGGKFDHIRTGGQGLKTLENVNDGYNGWKVPSAGAKVAFCWVNYDRTERTSLAWSTYP